MDLVEMRADVRTHRNKTREVWSFLALTPFCDSHRDNFFQGQVCHQSGLQAAGGCGDAMNWL